MGSSRLLWMSLTVSLLPGCSDPGQSPAETDVGEATGTEDSATSAADTPSTSSESSETGSTTGVSSSGPDDDASTSDSGDGSSTGEPGPPPFADVRNYIFGHSLLLHSPTSNVPRWLAAMSDSAGFSYTMSGQYGFADTHADSLPPIPQWGIDGVQSPWDDGDGQGFADVDFNTVLFTEANFRQYFPPTQPEPELGGPTSVSSTIAVFDWVNSAEPNVRYIVYENWPDMASFTAADFETTQPTSEELAAYWAFTSGDFHQWWLDYHDALREQRPDLRIDMVPVGPVLASLLTGPLSDIPPQVLYEDNAPHGRESLYFLAGIVTYMAIYASPPPAAYVPPPEVDPRIVERYEEVLDVAWTHVVSFEDGAGQSRVFAP